MSQMSLLRYKADYKTLIFVALYYAIAYGGFFSYWLIPELRIWQIVIPWVLLTCCMTFICAVIVHNTIHTPIFYNKQYNKWFQFVLSLSYGYSVSAYVPGHNFSHHKETQTPKDTMRTSKARFKWHLLNQLLFFFIIAADVFKAEKDFVTKMKDEKREWYEQWRAEIFLVYFIKVVLLIVNWPAALLFIWLPHLYGTWGIVGTNIWQHDGCDHDHPYNHSRTFTGQIFNFLVFNNGYHGAHHDRPSLHWSVLPAYHEQHIAPHIHPNLSQNNMLTYLFKAYIYPGKRVNYDGTPHVLPVDVPDEDWVADLSVDDRAHKHDFGAESSSVDDILYTNHIQEPEKAI